MKRYFFLLTCTILLAATSCKKDAASTIPLNTITANVDGKDQTFNVSVSGSLSDGIAPGSFLNVIGTTADGANTLSLVLSSSSKIVKGTFISSATNTTAVPSFLYSYAGSLASAADNSYASDINHKYSSTITITSISSGSVQGTFSGTIVNSLGMGTVTKTIANGKFNVTGLSHGVVDYQ